MLERSSGTRGCAIIDRSIEEPTENSDGYYKSPLLGAWLSTSEGVETSGLCPSIMMINLYTQAVLCEDLSMIDDRSAMKRDVPSRPGN
jgi:hypothetical protein